MGLFALRTVFNWNDPIEICVAEIWMTSVYRQRPYRTIDLGDADSQPQHHPDMNLQQSQPQVQFTFVLAYVMGAKTSQRPSFPAESDGTVFQAVEIGPVSLFTFPDKAVSKV